MPKTGKSSQVLADLRHKIAAGEYQPGDQLPRIQDLMRKYDMRSRSSMDRVLRTLVAEGALTVVHGSGIYVRRRHAVRRDLIAGLRLEHERAVGGKVETEGLFEATTGATDLNVAIAYDEISAPDRVAEALDLPLLSTVLRRTFRYTIANAPHQIAWSYLPLQTAAAADLTGPDGEVVGSGTIAQLHSAGVTVDRVTIVLENRMPLQQERDDLGIPEGTPVYEHWRVMFADGRPVEVSTAVVPGDRVAYVLTVDLGAGR